MSAMEEFTSDEVKETEVDRSSPSLLFGEHLEKWWIAVQNILLEACLI